MSGPLSPTWRPVFRGAYPDYMIRVDRGLMQAAPSYPGRGGRS
jgi:hypothetical protein